MSVKRYRKKPIEIEAILWDGENTAEVIKWVESCGGQIKYLMSDRDDNGDYIPQRLVILSLEGPHTIRNGGAYIIRGIEGEIYFNRQDIFEKTYEEV